jgi:dTDP-glucose 4,6-dehydratase
VVTGGAGFLGSHLVDLFLARGHRVIALENLVKGSCRLMLSPTNEPVNLGNPHELTILEFNREILRLTGAPRRIRYRPLPKDDRGQRQPDIRRARERLGWEPRIGLEQGLRQTIEWFRDRPGRRRG